MRTPAAVALAIALSALAAACGSNPIAPPPPPPPNKAPVIDSITIQGSKDKEPASFADVGETVQVAAKVRDDETPVDQLEYHWTSAVGAFAGSGAAVTWSAPPDAQTGDVTLTLKVVERYGAALQFQNEVTGSATLSLHDSVKEVGGMAQQFLIDFSKSEITDVPYIMRNFQPGCYGTQAETDQVAENRRKYIITRWSVGQPTVTISFGGIGPYNFQRGDAFASVPVHWESTIRTGGFESVTGIDWVAAMYYPDQRAWKLCDSEFQGHTPFGSTFIR